jgi:hypothetical protein
MERTPEANEPIRDLEPQAPEHPADATTDADDVRGGRKAGGGQQDYLKVTMTDVLIT